MLASLTQQVKTPEESIDSASKLSSVLISYLLRFLTSRDLPHPNTAESAPLGGEQDLPPPYGVDPSSLVDGATPSSIRLFKELPALEESHRVAVMGAFAYWCTGAYSLSAYLSLCYFFLRTYPQQN